MNDQLHAQAFGLVNSMVYFCREGPRSEIAPDELIRQTTGFMLTWLAVNPSREWQEAVVSELLRRAVMLGIPWLHDGAECPECSGPEPASLPGRTEDGGRGYAGPDLYKP